MDILSLISILRKIFRKISFPKLFSDSAFRVPFETRIVKAQKG
jgi:hypothetical protein